MHTQKPDIKIQALLKKGVCIPAPMSVEISADVDIRRISGDGVTIHRGCRISGRSTFIGPDTILGEEAPMTLDSCQLARGVRLKGGYAKKTVFLKNTQVGSGAHLREGTIFEEEASCAHTVGLKQTILLPFATLGSLINFCDVLMAGGTSRKDHSEVGSSYIHFNYTPNQDKATASLLGNVPDGVMLNKSPIFLGGQGGLVGPSRLAFGTVVAAGTIMRKDEAREGRLHFGGALRGGSVVASSGVYQNVKRVVKNNVHYIGNLLALLAWTRHVRGLFVGTDYPQEIHEAHQANLHDAIAERIKRLQGFAEKLPASLALGLERGSITHDSSLATQKGEVTAHIMAFQASLKTIMETQVLPQTGGAFFDHLAPEPDGDYIAAVQGLTEAQRLQGRDWLYRILDETEAAAARHFPLTYA